VRHDTTVAWGEIMKKAGDNYRAYIRVPVGVGVG
jgi:hypothetical protein